MGCADLDTRHWTCVGIGAGRIDRAHEVGIGVLPVEIEFKDGQPVQVVMTQGAFEIILRESDCLLGRGNPFHKVALRGAYAGYFPVYLLRVQVPQIRFDGDVTAVGVPGNPPNFDGIAGFCFLNRFTYGNFGDPSQFGLEI